MNTKLTLKSLKQELDNIKLKSNSKLTKSKIESNVKKVPHIQDQDIKNSYINRLYMRSGAMWLFMITGILGYLSKLPFIGKILSALGLYYRKSSFWQLLVKIRKIFVVFNALIGVYIVFKSVGFSTDNLIAGFVCVGETYIQTLFNVTSKLFHWFVELFDHKIVPNVPGDGTWFNKPKIPKYNNNSLIVPSNLNLPDIVDKPYFSLRELYKNSSITENKSWFNHLTDYNTLWWLGVAIGTIGFIYLGYNIYTDPSYLFGNNPKTNIHPPTPPINPNADDITLAGTLIDRVTDFSRGCVKVYNSTINALNPFNYFVTSKEIQSQYNLYMEVQNDIARSNRNMFPFTENNPFDPRYKKLRLYYFGGKEFIERSQLINKADALYESLRVKGKSIGNTLFSASNSPWSSNINSPVLSPIANTIGLHSSVLDAFNAATTSITQEKLLSIPNSPSNVPFANLWGENTMNSVEELESRLRLVKNPLASTSANATVFELDSPPTPRGSSYNKFSALSEEEI